MRKRVRVRAYVRACVYAQMSAVRAHLCIRASMRAQRLLQCVYRCMRSHNIRMAVRVCDWLVQVQRSVICSHASELWIFYWNVFLNPTFFPRLSYSVGEKMLGANTQYRLFGEDWTRFFSQYFRTVPTSVISCACLVDEYSG